MPTVVPKRERVDQLGRHFVVLFQVVLGGHQALAHEALHGGQQDVEGFVVEGHVVSWSGRRLVDDDVAGLDER